MPRSRLMWIYYEPIHAIDYYHPRARAVFEAAGVRGAWRQYFAGRAAPLGRVEAAPVIAAFLTFEPTMVARALPAVWELATPEQALDARLAGATEALAELTRQMPPAALAEAADRLQEVTGRLEHSGKVLSTSNAALPVPQEPLARLWQATTTLREHRGDGHIAAVVAAGLDGCEIVVWRASTDQSREVLQPFRGWSDEQWQAASERLIERGWLDREGKPTSHGQSAFAEIERTTEELAGGAWRALSDTDFERLRELLVPIGRACYASLPGANPVGVPAPR